MFTQQFRVRLEQSDGTIRTTVVTADQRDLSQLELQPWHSEGITLDDEGRSVGPRRVTTNLRFLAYSAMRRWRTPEVTDWETFNTRVCVDVEALDDDDQGDDTDPNPHGPSTSSAGN